MMGYQHALGGAAAWLAALPALDATVGLTPGQAVLGAGVSVGGGMILDLDQRGSTVGRTYGPVTNLTARLVAAVSGGHRNGTHSILGVAVSGGLAALAVHLGGWYEFTALWLLLGAADSALGISPRKWKVLGLGHAIVMAAVTGFILASGVDTMVPLVAGTVLGAASHVGLDMLNPQRCPLLWPVQKRRYGVSVVTTGGEFSTHVTVLLTLLVVALVVVQTPLRLVLVGMVTA